MSLEMSCALATSPDSPEHIRIAEQLGYRRAYLYDSPPLYPDVWMQLGRAADRTSEIVLGPSGLIPSNRTVLTTASAIATLAGIVGPDRVSVALGTGMTSRLATGKRPLRWAYVTDYVRALRGLLRGEAVEWEGALIQMLHSDGFAPLPLDVELLLAVAGPKGRAAAEEVADGVFGGMEPVAGFDRSPALCWGTVLGAGEDAGSERVLTAAGHVASVTAHWSLEFGDVAEVLSRGVEWRQAYEEIPAERRHLAMHREHLVGMNEIDRPFIDGALVTELGLALTPAEWQDRLADLEDRGATEVAYQPAGDVPAELERFAALWAGHERRPGPGPRALT